MYWKKNESNIFLQKRRRHASCLINDSIYTFGGDLKAKLEGDDPEFYSNEILQFSIKTKQMIKVDAKNPPNGLFGFSMCKYKDNFIVFGGIEFPMFVSNKFYEYDTKKNIWNHVKYHSNDHGYFFGHTTVSYQDKIIVYGGYHPRDESNGVFILSKNIFYQIKTTGEVPEYGRYCHTAIEYQGKMFIFGGKNDTFGRNNKLYSLDLKGENTFKWSLLISNGDIPSPRAGHSMTEMDGLIYIFGGFDGKMDLNDLYQYNIKTSTWKEIYTTSRPQISSFHSTIAYKNHGSTYLFKFGGLAGPDNNFNFYNDIHEIEVESNISNSIFQKKNNYIDVFIFLQNFNG